MPLCTQVASLLRCDHIARLDAEEIELLTVVVTFIDARLSRPHCQEFTARFFGSSWFCPERRTQTLRSRNRRVHTTRRPFCRRATSLLPRYLVHGRPTFVSGL